MPSAPLRIRPADDPEHPEAVVIERFEPLKLKPLYDHRPMGWVVIAWHPSRAAAVETFEQVKVSARERTEQADALLAQLVPTPPMPEAPWIFGSSMQASAVDGISPDGEPLWFGKPAVNVRIGHQWLDKARAVLAEQGGFWLWVLAEGGDPKTTPVLGGEPAPPQAPVEAQGPTVADAVGVLMRKMEKIVDAKLIAFKREQADALGLTLAEQWEQVVNRFKRAPTP